MSFPPLPPASPSVHASLTVLSDLERAILLTVLYADLFDYPLTEEELYRRLVHVAPGRTTFSHACMALVGPYLTATEGYVTWTGREHLVSLREHRRRVAEALWTTAQRYGRWLAKVPFVRMVAVSGSLAVCNAEEKSDIDLFCITAPNRLWIARSFIVPLSKLTRKLPQRFPLYLCPNYILALNALEVTDHNLFTAHEVAQAVPLWGEAMYHRFLHANAWIYTFLPHTRFEDLRQPPRDLPRPGYTRGLEYLLRGRLGDALDRLMYRLFLTFYRKRAARAGWPWHRLAAAYQRNRYTVPEGGYVRVIRRRFLQQIQQHLGTTLSERDLETLFPIAADDAHPTIYEWERLFAEEYGLVKREGAH